MKRIEIEPRDMDKVWDLRLKVIGLVALIASGSWTLYKFREDRRIDLLHEQQAISREEFSKNMERNSFIFQRQTMLYFDAARSAATIATSKDQQDVKKAKERFEELYFGEMVVVEDRRVELAMITFQRCLEEKTPECYRYPFDQNHKLIPDEQMKRLGPGSLPDLSFELAACVRSALTTDRLVDFGSLSDPNLTCPYSVSDPPPAKPKALLGQTD
jgi:hypothetical protein